MKKIVIILSVFLLFAMVLPASAVRFTDMPNNHWAAKSVYDLVNRGITQGFPDGTFRGNEKLTRYETAVFLSKMAKSIESKVGAGEAVDLSGVRNDIRALKAEIAALRRAKSGTTTVTQSGLEIGGSLCLDYKLVNLIGGTERIVTTRGPVIDYRLKTSIAKDLGEGATLKVGLDTEDYGNYNALGAPDFARRLIDAVATFQLDWSAIGLSSPIALALSTGPGSRAHTNTAVDPANDGTIIDREYNAVKASTDILGVEVDGAVYGSVTGTNGLSTGRLISGGLGFNLGDLIPTIGGLKVGVAADVEKTNAEAVVDSHLVVDATASLGIDTVKGALVLGGSGVDSAANDKLLYGLGVTLDDVWSSGTVVDIAVTRVGVNYITSAANLIDPAGRDVFNRALANNSLDIGAKLTQQLGTIKLIGIADYLSAADGTRTTTAQTMTLEGGIAYEVAPAAELTAAYRYQKLAVVNGTGDDTADSLSVGLLYSF